MWTLPLTLWFWFIIIIKIAGVYSSRSALLISRLLSGCFSPHPPARLISAPLFVPACMIPPLRLSSRPLFRTQYSPIFCSMSTLSEPVYHRAECCSFWAILLSRTIFQERTHLNETQPPFLLFLTFLLGNPRPCLNQTQARWSLNSMNYRAYYQW